MWDVNNNKGLGAHQHQMTASPDVVSKNITEAPKGEKIITQGLNEPVISREVILLNWWYNQKVKTGKWYAMCNY